MAIAIGMTALPYSAINVKANEDNISMLVSEEIKSQEEIDKEFEEQIKSKTNNQKERSIAYKYVLEIHNFTGVYDTS